MSSRALLAIVAAVIALAAVGALGACDGAFDGRFRGQPVGVVSGVALLRGLGPAFPNNVRWKVGASIIWAGLRSADGADGETLVDDQVAFTLDAERRFRVVAYVAPPERLARAAERGAVVLGQLVFWADLAVDGRRDASDPILGRPATLVGWTSDGAGGGLVAGELAPGLHALAASTPCDRDDLRVAPLVAGQSVDVTLTTTPPLGFFDAACVGTSP